MNNLKSNYVVIVKTGVDEFTKVKELCNNKPFIDWFNGMFCIIGNFDVKKLEGYEFYDVKTDWCTISGFQDRPI